MEVDLSLGWKLLNLERYDETIDPNEHLDIFLTQANLYTNDDVILCRVFPMSLKRVALTWYEGLPPRSIDSFNTLVERFSSQYATSRSHHLTSAALASYARQMRSHFSNLWTSSFESLSKSRISILRWRYIPCRWPCDLGRLPTVCARNLLIAWMSYRNEPRVTFIWKKCQGSKMKSNKLNKKGRKVKVAQGLTHTSWTSGTNQTNVSLFWGDPGTSITHP